MLIPYHGPRGKHVALGCRCTCAVAHAALGPDTQHESTWRLRPKSCLKRGDRDVVIYLIYLPTPFICRRCLGIAIPYVRRRLIVPGHIAGLGWKPFNSRDLRSFLHIHKAVPGLAEVIHLIAAPKRSRAELS